MIVTRARVYIFIILAIVSTLRIARYSFNRYNIITWKYLTNSTNSSLLTPLLPSGRELSNYEDIQSDITANSYDLKSPSRIVLTMSSKGRMGNNMCQYAHLYIFGSYSNVQVMIEKEMRQKLKHFTNISIPVIDDEKPPLKFKDISLYETYEAIEKNKSMTAMVLPFPCEVDLLIPHQKVWKEQFNFSSKLKETVAQRKEKLLVRWQTDANHTDDNLVMVAVHIRRTDIINVLVKYTGKGYIPNKYYFNAFDYYRKRFNNVMFVICSDDLNWCRENFGTIEDALIVNEGSAMEDMALMASFEHHIYSQGTFSLWIIMLSEIKTIVYPAKISTDKDRGRYLLYKCFDKIRTDKFVQVPY